MLVRGFVVILIFRIYFLRIHIEYLKSTHLLNQTLESVYMIQQQLNIWFHFIYIKHIMISKLSGIICVPEYENNSEWHNLGHKKSCDFKAFKKIFLF